MTERGGVSFRCAASGGGRTWFVFTHFVDPSPFNFREPPVDWYAEEGILPTRIPVLLLHLLRLNSTSVTVTKGGLRSSAADLATQPGFVIVQLRKNFPIRSS